MKIECNPGWDPRTEIGHQVKTKEMRIKCIYQLIMCQRWFITCDQHTVLMQDVNNGKLGVGYNGNSLFCLHAVFINLNVF